MGSLRFRKSVSICKGVRLNFGKKGVSISSDIPGFRKTYNFNTGKTTTTVGIPGTGIYYVDTSGPSQKKQEKKSGGFFSSLFGGSQNSSAPASNNAPTYRNSTTSKEPATAKPTTPMYPVYGDNTVSHAADIPSKVVITENKNKNELTETIVNDSKARPVVTIPSVDEFVTVPNMEPVSVVTDEQERKPEEITYDTIKTIFESCDVAIDWVDVLSHKTPTSNEVVSETWEYLHKKAVAVFDGDIDTYLEIISTVNPYDDLLDYAENFEFGTDDPTMMEVEFSVIEDNTSKLKKNVFEDYYCAIAVRVARDTFALLPVEQTIVHVMHKGKEILNASFDRKKIHELDVVGLDASDLVKQIAVIN